LLKDQAISVDSKALTLLPSVKGIVNLFIEDDPTLTLDAGIYDNATAMSNRLNDTAGNICAVWSVASNSVITATFTDCMVNDLWLSGQVTATVSRDTSNVLTVSFVLTNVAVNGYEMSGSVVVKAPTITTYPTTMTLALTHVGGLTFDGTGAISIPDSSRLTASVTGSGKVTAPASDAGADAGSLRLKSVLSGWTCDQVDDPAYVVTGLSRALGACQANGGSATVTRVFDCRHADTIRNPHQTIVSTALLAWRPETPTDSRINVTVGTAIGDASTPGTTELVTLPWTCQLSPIGPEPQPEPQAEAGPGAEPHPEAGPDAADASDASDASDAGQD
jgi:hypothetical protein